MFKTIINDTSLDKEIKNLVIYKKALFYAAEIDDNENDLLDILNPLINSESVWKSHSLYLMAEYYYSKNQKQKNNKNSLPSIIENSTKTKLSYVSDFREKSNLRNSSTEKSKKHFLIKNRERYYKTNNMDQPLVYCFNIDSCGDIDVRKIFKMACDFLTNKLDYIIDNISLDSDILEIFL